MLRSAAVAGILAGFVVAGQTPATVAVPTDIPYWVGVNEVTNRVYATTSDHGVVVIDGARDTVVTLIPVYACCLHDIAVNATTNRIYVTTDKPSVAVIDGARNSFITHIRVGSIAEGVGVNPTTNRIYVATRGYYEEIVSVIDGERNKVIATIPVEVGPPHGVGVNSTTNRIYVSSQPYSPGNDFVSVIDGAQNKVIATIPVGVGPSAVGVNEVTNRIYVANIVSDSVSVIDGSQNTVIATIPVGDSPFGVGMDPATNRIYASSHDGDSVFIIDGAQNKVIATIPVGEGPFGVAVNPTTNRFYVANYYSENISVVVGNDLLKNPSFDGDQNGDGLPDAWRSRNLKAGDGLDSDFFDKYDGRFSMRLSGSEGVTKTLVQRSGAGGPVGTVLNLEAFSKADGRTPDQGAYWVEVRAFFADQTSAAFDLNFGRSGEGTFGWRRRARSFTVPKNYDSLVARVIYANPTGTVWFDALHLWPSK